jgi:hypothetical protein
MEDLLKLIQANQLLSEFIEANRGEKNDFNGGYIKATERAFDLLTVNGYTPHNKNFSIREKNRNNGFYAVNDNEIRVTTKDFLETNMVYKQFFVNSGQLSWDEPKQSELELMKEKYATGDYLIYYFHKQQKRWLLGNNQSEDVVFNYTNKIKLIHKDNAHIAEAVAKDSSVEVEYQLPLDASNHTFSTRNFFKDYKEELLYALAKQPTKDLSGYRIEATRDNNKEVKELIHERKDVIVQTDFYEISMEYFAIPNADLDKMCHDFSNINFKQAYLHNHELVLEEPKEDVCKWSHVGGRGTNNFNTTCKREYAHKDSDYEFCPYCGKPLVAPIEKEQK